MDGTSLQQRQGQVVEPLGMPGLHYFGCGCSGKFDSAHLVDMAFERANRLRASQRYDGGEHSSSPRRLFTVVYVLPHHSVTGGMKMLVEHVRLLRSRGHRAKHGWIPRSHWRVMNRIICAGQTIALHRSETAPTAMPPWTSVRADVDIVAGLNQRFSEVFPELKGQGVDVVIVGIFYQVPEMLIETMQPVLYWEQGHEWLFGDPIRFLPKYAKHDILFHHVMNLPVALASVSAATSSIIQREFQRFSVEIPNGINPEQFTPNGPVSARFVREKAQRPQNLESQRPTVLLVGNPALPLKGFDLAIQVLALVNAIHPIRITWICQTQPDPAKLPGLDQLQVDVCLDPPQDAIPSLYRGHDAMLFTSYYEAWGMPILEGMASGLAVVATDCQGSRTYAFDNYNCLVRNPGDVNGLSMALYQVLLNDDLRRKLQGNARDTAVRFKMEGIVDKIEETVCLLKTIAPELLRARQTGASEILRASFLASISSCNHAKLTQEKD